VWVRRYNDPANGSDFATSVQVSPDGSRVYVTGASWGSKFTKRDYVTIAYGRAGGTLWVRRFNGPGSRDDVATALARSPDGSRIFVTGRSYGGAATGMDYATVAYSSSGTRLWIRRYDGPAHARDGASAIAVSPDGQKVYVTGTSAGATDDSATIAYNAATGARLWAGRYDSGGGDSTVGLAVSSDGTRVYVTGGTGISDYLTVAYDAATGTQAWAQDFYTGGDCGGSASALGVSRDGARIYVTGWACGSAGDSTADTVAYSSDGTELWEQLFAGYGAFSLAVSQDGTRVYVGLVGGLEECADDAWCVIAYTSDGTELWDSGFGRFCEFLPFPPSEPSGLRVSRDGSRIYAAGITCPNGENYVTLALNSKGTRIWTRQYNGPGNGNDDAHALALSPDGLRLYVTGASWGGSLSHYDYATIAYNTT
jgi:DNA-binding beta-propeller fold protein YncE